MQDGGRSLPVHQKWFYRALLGAEDHACQGKMEFIRADFFGEGDEDSNFLIFRIRRFTEWPGPLH